MNGLLKLHIKAAVVCALAALVVALPLLWVPSLVPAKLPWRSINPIFEAFLAVFAASWVAWCVIDIPRFTLKVLVWGASLWLLGAGIWIADNYADRARLAGTPDSFIWYEACSAVPLLAGTLSGLAALAFSFSPAGSRKARWRSLVEGRVSPALLRARIDEGRLTEAPRSEVVAVAELLWPGGDNDEALAWRETEARAKRAAGHFQAAGGYMERSEGEGARFVFGCWGGEAEPAKLVQVLWDWVTKEGGCAALARGECVTGVADLPAGARWTLSGAPARRAARMAVASRGYAARIVIEGALADDIRDDWASRRLAWWDFEGSRVLLHEVVGPANGEDAGSGEALRRWERAWDSFWEGDWAAAEHSFGALARERDDAAARVFALRSAAARRHGPEL